MFEDAGSELDETRMNREEALWDAALGVRSKLARIATDAVDNSYYPSPA